MTAIVKTKKKPQFSFRVKLIMFFFGLLALTQLGIFAIVRQQIQKANRAENYQYLLEESNISSATLGETIWDNLEFLQLISYNGNVTNALIQSNREYAKQGDRLKEKLANSEKQWSENKDSKLVKEITNSTSAKELQKAADVITHLNKLYITNKYGGLVSSSKYVDRFDYTQQLWWKTTYNQGKGNIYVGNLKLTENQESLVLPIAIPIYTNSKSTEIIGVIYAEHIFNEELANIFGLNEAEEEQMGEEHIHRIYMGSNSYFDYENNVINTEPQLTLDEIMKQLPNAKRFKYENSLNFLTAKQITSLESDSIFSETIDNLGWYLVTITAYEEENLFSLPTRIVVMLIAAIILLMLSIAFTIYILNVITNPLKQMIEVAENINDDTFEPEDLNKLDEAIKMENEIGQLASVFKQMAQLVTRRTQNLQEQIEQMKNKGLHLGAGDGFGNGDLDFKDNSNDLNQRKMISVLKKAREIRSRFEQDDAIELIPSLPSPLVVGAENIDLDLKAKIQGELALHIGPLAEHIIDDTIGNNPKITPRELIELLAEEIPDLEKADNFKEQLNTLI